MFGESYQRVVSTNIPPFRNGLREDLAEVGVNTSGVSLLRSFPSVVEHQLLMASGATPGPTSMVLVLLKYSRNVVFPLAMLPSIQI